VELTKGEVAVLDKLLMEVVTRRDSWAGVDTLQWRRYANAETVLVELRDGDGLALFLLLQQLARPEGEDGPE
jgi:hypothetical protein